MKRYFIIATILFLAAGCGKQTQPVLTAPAAAQNQPAQNQPTATPPQATTTKPTIQPKPVPLTLSVYDDPAGIFSINYTSDFVLVTPAELAANTIKSENTSACVPGGTTPSVCFVLKGAPYKATNLSSAAISIKSLPDKADLGKCATFDISQLGVGHLGNPVMINGVVFVTAVSDDVGAGNYHQIQMSRAFYNRTCYEIDETIGWAAAGNFSPPRTELDKSLIWPKLDAVRGNFRFVR